MQTERENRRAKKVNQLLPASRDSSKDAGKKTVAGGIQSTVKGARDKATLATIMNAVKGSGYDVQGAATMRSAAGNDAQSVCEKEFEKYLDMSKLLTPVEVPPSSAPSWYKDKQFQLPNLAVVYRQIAGKANSAGCLENDFCAAGTQMDGKRTRLDPRFMDAQLFCNCNFGLVSEIPKKDIKVRANMYTCTHTHKHTDSPRTHSLILTCTHTCWLTVTGQV